LTVTDQNQKRLVRLGLDCISQILTLQDRVAHSPTCGCFDRAYWHLRVKDFPSGMAQELLLPLALAYAKPFNGNGYYRDETLREWVRAGIAFAERSAHRDGSCDDNYPFERAADATALSQYAMLESLSLAEIDAAPFLDFLMRRGSWLTKKRNPAACLTMKP